MLVAYGVRRDGSRQLLAFQRSAGESQAAWEGLLRDLYRRGLEGQQLALIVTDGCPGLAAAIQVVYPRVLHQKCWVHKMRNLLEKVRQRDYDGVRAEAQAIYQAPNRAAAQEAFVRFQKRWRRDYPSMRRRTRPMACFVNVASVDRIIYSIFHRFNLEWRNCTLQVFTQAA